MIDLTGRGGVEFTDDDRGVSQQIGEQRRGIRAHGTDFGEREVGQVQGESERRSDIEPNQRRKSAPGQRGERGSVEDFPADHAAGATRCR